jgi:tetratricopeptide (TPR) repeat protein
MTRFARSVAALTACLLLAVVAGDAFAQEGGRKRDNRSSQTMTKQVATKLIAAQEMLQAGQIDSAKRELDAVIKRRGLRPLELANIYNLYAYVANEQDDPKKAIAYFTKAIQEDALPLAQQYGLEYNVAQLYMMQGDFERALKILRAWFKKVRTKDSPVTPNGGNYYMLSLCYMNQSPPDVKRARKPAEIAIEISENPQENWLRMLGQIYYVQKEWDLLAETLERLIETYNKPDYYTQLSGAYAEAGEELKSLAVLQLAYQQGLLQKKSQLKHLAQMYLYHEIPYRAAVVLEKGFEEGLLDEELETLRLLADSWIAAREADKSFEPLSKAAALAENGDLYMRLGQAFVQKQRWAEADEALGSALSHKELKDRGGVHLLRGVARMNRESWSSAKASFEAAAKFDDNRQSAEQYIKYLEARKQQVEALRS